MKRNRYTEAQIVRILREADCEPVCEVAKRHGVSDVTIYTWRKRFGDMETNDVKRLKSWSLKICVLKNFLQSVIWQSKS